MPRRDGDVAECWSDSTKANDKLEWKANRELYDMIRDAWNWQSKILMVMIIHDVIVYSMNIIYALE